MSGAMRRARILALAVTLGFSASLMGCRATRSDMPRAVQANGPPAALLGAFTDDYGGRYTITASAWQHGARNRYEVVAWYPDSQFVIARNANSNPTAAGLWTRIDWMLLSEMAPYTWAFCLSAYEAPTRVAAQATRVANRTMPRTGCNGFPFSRMERVMQRVPE